MKRVRYITSEQAIFYQQKIIKTTGGSLGLRDLNLEQIAKWLKEHTKKKKG